jgi:hypothetical protein
MEKLVIDRTKWLRGEGVGCLLDPEREKMCCLGFEMLRLGYGTEQIHNVGMPISVSYGPANNTWLVESGCRGAADVSRLSQINDNTGLPAVERETKIAEIFARHNIEVEFIN